MNNKKWLSDQNKSATQKLNIMDPGQFQQFTQGLAQQEGARIVTQNRRALIKDLVRQTSPCDGTPTSAVRNWIREIGLALNQVGDGSIIEVVSKTVTGPLRFEIERFIARTIDADLRERHEVPWPALRDHVAAQFLNIDEAAALRDEVEKVRQSAYEPTVQYCRRFREVADAAYPVGRSSLRAGLP